MLTYGWGVIPPGSPSATPPGRPRWSPGTRATWCRSRTPYAGRRPSSRATRPTCAWCSEAGNDHRGASPVTHARFGDVATMVGPKRPESNVCWCLSHRIDARTNRELTGPDRGAYVEELHPADGQAGRAGLRRRGGRRLGRRSPPAQSCRSPGRPGSRTSTTCRSGRCGACAPGLATGGRGISHHLLSGAVDYAPPAGGAGRRGLPRRQRGRRSTSPWPTSAPAGSSRPPASPSPPRPTRSPAVFRGSLCGWTSSISSGIHPSGARAARCPRRRRRLPSGHRTTRRRTNPNGWQIRLHRT